MTQEELNKFLLERVNQPGQFPYANGMEMVEAAPGYAKGILKVTDHSHNPYGIVHGGALMALADTVAGVCAASKGGRFVTANASIEFLRPATGDLITCVATPKKMGRTLPVISVEVVDEKDVVVATGTFSFFRIDI